MKKSDFGITIEALKIKKELECIAKTSKDEYKSAKGEEKEAIQLDLGLQTKQISDQLVRKGKEVLGVSGKQRRGSSTKSSADKRKNRTKAAGDVRSKVADAALDVKGENYERTNDSLNVVMKGQSLKKSDRKLVQDDQESLQFQTNLEMEDTLNELYEPDNDQSDATKPAIVSSTNTTKSIILETKRPRKQKYEPPKRFQPRRSRSADVKASVSEAKASHISSTLDGRTGSSKPSSLDINVGENLAFDDLDEEFYNIMRSKLNLEIANKETVNLSVDETLHEINDLGPKEGVADETAATSMMEEMEKGNTTLASKSVPRLNPENVQVCRSAVKVQNLEMLPPKEDKMRKQEKQTQSDNQAAILSRSFFDVPASDGPKRSTADQGKDRKGEKNIKPEEKKSKKQASIRTTLSQREVTAQVMDMNLDIGDKIDTEAFISKEEALQALSLSTDILNEDVVHITGDKASTVERPLMIPANNSAFVSKDALHNLAKQRKGSFLTSWSESKRRKATDKESAQQVHIHHFCTSIPAIQLPGNLKMVSKNQHAPDKYAVMKGSTMRNAAKPETRRTSTAESKFKNFEALEPKIITTMLENDKLTEEEIRLTELAEKILQEAVNQAEEPKAEKSFMKLQHIVNQLFNENDQQQLQIDGRRMQIRNDETRLYWTPAPPKLDIPPEAVRQQLIPSYKGAVLNTQDEIDGFNELNDAIQEESSSDEDIELNRNDKFRQRVIDRAYGSASLKGIKERQELKREVEEEGETMTALPSSPLLTEMQRTEFKLQEAEAREESEIQSKKSNDDFVIDVSKRRTLSQPLLKIEDMDYQKFDSDYDASFQELKSQSKKLRKMKNDILDQRLNQEENIIDDFPTATIYIEESMVDKVDDAASVSNLTVATNTAEAGSRMLSVDHLPVSGRDTKTSSHSKKLPLKGFRKTVKKKTQMKRRPDPERERQIKDFLSEPARMIERSISFDNLIRTKDSKSEPLKRSSSLEARLDFDKEIGHRYDDDESDLLYWLKEEYWYKWFDELYPPSIPSDEEDDSQAQLAKEKSNIDEEILQQIEVIKPEAETDAQKNFYLTPNDTTQSPTYEVTPQGPEAYVLLKKEIDSMTTLIKDTEENETLAMHLCRRGACYRKIGELKNARDDLERAIELEPKLVDAYWHRHMLFLLQENFKKALSDLDFVLKYNTSHVGAYRSRAELYKKKGDLTMAIFNYSQAIKFTPNNADIYYDRAYMFQEISQCDSDLHREKWCFRGDVLLALEDFKLANSLLPSRTEAIKNIGIYHFEHRSWSAAINDFTAMLQQEPYNPEAYTYRGRACANMAQFKNALRDLSMAIHLDPNNSLAFYHRGCLLRKASQRQSLQDLSTSLLLDNSVRNVNAYLHRGILYTELKRWEEAVSDFEAALRLNSHIPAAHVNLGLIHMTKMNNPHWAIRRCNIAIRVDPTYVRAYICRAEAHQRMHMIDAAILDYTRAIHIRPDVIDYRMTRGKLLMDEGKFDLSSFHIRQSAQMSKGAGTSSTQQAAVQVFLKNYSQAIEILERTARISQVPQLYILLGKTKMKAKLYKEAIASFTDALNFLKPTQIFSAMDSMTEWPIGSANVYFQIGIAYTEMVNHSSALEAFNNAIRINPEYAEAYYQRGLAKMKLRHAKSIHDFNRALAYNPKFFQAYLSRAAYYGMKGRFAKAIMNCNEAIRLQPNSIRGYLYRGALKYFIKSYQFAVKDLTQAIAIYPSCNLAYFNRAVCFHEMKHYQRALMDYGVVLLLEKKDNTKVLQNRGLLYLDIGDLSNALQDLAAASKLEPRNPTLHHTLGICYHRLGMLEDAITCFSDALRIDSFFIDALLGRGNATMDYSTPQSNTKARRDFLRALRLDPKSLSARVNLAYSLQVQGRFQAAWMQFTKCMDLDEGYKAAYEGRAIINLQMGNTFGAFLDINQALKIEETAEFLTNRGVINQFMGDKVNAMRDYQAALKRDPSYALAYYNAANLYFAHRQFQQALVHYDRAIGWNNMDESAVLNRAITRVMLRDLKGALDDFDRAVELSPQAAHIYFNRGNLYASMERYNDAEKDYTTALSLQPGDALVYKRRADVRGKLSMKTEALDDYKKAIFIQTQRMQAPKFRGRQAWQVWKAS